MYSVVIPAKNEETNIARCIKSVFNCVGKRDEVEVIVVDNGSTDRTREVAEKEGAKVLVDEAANISGLRNLGVAHSSYTIIGFIDADCEAVQGWLENAKNILTAERIGIVGGCCRVPEEGTWVERAYISSTYLNRREVSYVGSANMVIQRKNFVRVGGFDENVVTGEDYVLCLKLKAAGLKVIADSSVSVVHHGYPKSLQELARREMWHGLGMFDLCKYGRVTLPLVWSFLNIVVIVWMFVALILGRLHLVLVLTTLMMAFPLGASFLRCRRNNSWRYLIEMYFFFLVYGFARTVSIFKMRRV